MTQYSRSESNWSSKLNVASFWHKFRAAYWPCSRDIVPSTIPPCADEGDQSLHRMFVEVANQRDGKHVHANYVSYWTRFQGNHQHAQYTQHSQHAKNKPFTESKTMPATGLLSLLMTAIGLPSSVASVSDCLSCKTLTELWVKRTCCRFMQIYRIMSHRIQFCQYSVSMVLIF